MKKLYIIILILFLTGCASLGMVDSTVTWHDGKIIKVHSEADSIVTVKKDKEEVIVDNRGRPGFIEQIFGAILMGRVKEK